MECRYMTDRPTITTLKELRDRGYEPRSVRDEMRANLISALREGRRLFSGIFGYEETVIPLVENAILAGHDIILLGERGQAKTRLARSLVQLLDPWVPVIEGSETNDDPMHPVSAYGRRMRDELGDTLSVAWLPRDRRFAEKLATPDTTIADLIGEVDPIKVAEGRYLSNEEVIAFGLIPRTNRGVFNLNELPDLAERIQVGLLNILEEKDVQIRGFQIRLPLDVMVVASANPEDYTNRGRIITPLKDRFGSQIRTHYPVSVEHELRIVDQEQATRDLPGIDVHVPGFMRELVAEMSRAARASNDVSQRSGVSVRMTIANFEAIIANAQRRALLLGEDRAVPRVSDLHAVYPTMMGKLELDAFGDRDEADVVERIIAEATRRVFISVSGEPWVDDLTTAIDGGLTVDASDMQAVDGYRVELLSPTVTDGLQRLAGSSRAQDLASALEFVLEGLFRTRRVGRVGVGRAMRYAR
jgi:magnesium chelatase subunit I